MWKLSTDKICALKNAAPFCWFVERNKSAQNRVPKVVKSWQYRGTTGLPMMALCTKLIEVICYGTWQAVSILSRFSLKHRQAILSILQKLASWTSILYTYGVSVFHLHSKYSLCEQDWTHEPVCSSSLPSWCNSTAHDTGWYRWRNQPRFKRTGADVGAPLLNASRATNISEKATNKKHKVFFLLCLFRFFFSAVCAPLRSSITARAVDRSNCMTYP